MAEHGQMGRPGGREDDPDPVASDSAAFDPYDMVALEARIAQARERRAEAFARRKAGAPSEKPVAPPTTRPTQVPPQGAPPPPRAALPPQGAVLRPHSPSPSAQRVAPPTHSASPPPEPAAPPAAEVAPAADVSPRIEVRAARPPGAGATRRRRSAVDVPLRVAAIALGCLLGAAVAASFAPLGLQERMRAAIATLTGGVPEVVATAPSDPPPAALDDGASGSAEPEVATVPDVSLVSPPVEAGRSIVAAVPPDAAESAAPARSATPRVEPTPSVAEAAPSTPSIDALPPVAAPSSGPAAILPPAFLRAGEGEERADTLPRPAAPAVPAPDLATLREAPAAPPAAGAATPILPDAGPLAAVTEEVGTAAAARADLDTRAPIGPAPPPVPSLDVAALVGTVAAPPEPAPPDESAAAAAARVLVHYPPDAAEDATAAVEALQAAGVADASAVPSGISVSRSNIRYYHSADAEAAQGVSGILSAALDFDAPEPRDFTDFRPQPQSGIIEVWLAGEAPARATPPVAATASGSAQPRQPAAPSAAQRQAAEEAQRLRLQQAVESLLRDRLRRN